MTKETRRWFLDSVRAAGWAPILVFAVHVLAWRVFGAYRAVPHFDVPMHLLGGAAVGYFFWTSLRLPSARDAVGALTRFGRVSMTIASVCAVALAWEGAEWLLRQTRSIGWPRLGDTGLDLLVGTFGGLLFLAAAALRPRRGAARGAA